MDDATRIFVAESNELLDEMENSLLVLEDSPRDTEAVNSVFRAVHTIKGSAGVLGLEDIEKFAHMVENALDMVRNGTVAVTGGLVELMLECRDHMAGLVAGAHTGEKLDEVGEANERRLSKELTAIVGPLEKPKALEEAKEEPEPEELDEGRQAENPNWHISLRFGPDVFRNGMDPISFIAYLSRLGEVISLTTLFDSMPPEELMDPESCYLGFEIEFKSDFEKKDIEEVFEFVREDCRIKILPPRSSIDSYIRLIEEMPEDRLKLGEILVSGGALTESELEEALAEGEDGGRLLGEILVEENMVYSPVVEAALKKQKRATETRSVESKTIRVDTEKLDQLINMVGELVISGANINQQAERIHDKNLIQSVYVLSRLIEDIRDKAMRVRMIPLLNTFNSYRRVVRDISHESGKEIQLSIRGGETEMDKTVIEKIKDPLMHIVRNAGDHGIEYPEEREAAGKPRTGTIEMSAYQDMSDIVIEISDDGRGLNRERILEKAVSMGMIHDPVGATDHDIYRVIFEPGFSTAEKVTNISGRGVGMDVVKRNIESLRGTVDIDSVEGAGTKISIRLPLTLAIIDGFLVGIGEHFYVVPMDSVVECLELTPEARRAAHGRHHVNLRGEVLPYIRLRDMFGEDGETAPEVENILVVRYAADTTGLVVDHLHGEVQAVIKNLGRFYRDIRGVSGATILGDGTVALILDIKGLVQTALELQEKRIR